MILNRVIMDMLYLIIATLMMAMQDPQETPFAFAGMVIGLSHAVIDLAQAINEEDDPSCSVVYKISDTMSDLLPLACTNIEFYLKSSQLNPYAYAHFFTVLPVFYDIFATLSDEDYDSSPSEYLKSITVLLNCLSMAYVGYVDDNVIYFVFAGTVFLSKAGTKIMKKIGLDYTNEVRVVTGLIKCGLGYFMANMENS